MHYRSRPALQTSLLALVATAVLSTPAWAQEAPAAEPAADPAATPAQEAPQSAVVTRIQVQGAQRIDPSTILSYLPIQPGDVVDDAVINLAVRTLFRTDHFSDVQIALQPNGTLVIQVAENPIINQVVFEGNSALNEESLREEITVRPRGVYTRARVQAEVQRIVELYRRSGRISATVTPKLVQLEQNRVDLIFEIDEGVQTGVRNINILGNSAYSDGDLRDVMVTERSNWWNFLSSNDNYDPNRLEYDREQLRDFYTNRGYYDFRVVSSVAELTPDQEDFQISLTIDEGDPYEFGDLQVETENERLNAEFLRALIPIRTGDRYESDRVEQAVEALTFAAGAAGYAFVDIRPVETPNSENDTVDITFQVREGPRVYVERIDIVGNTQTIDPVIRREMMLTEGDAFNQALVDMSRNNLRRLNFFEDVTIERVQGSAPDRTVLQVGVQEQPTGTLSFGAGFSSVDSFIIDLGVTQSNFRGRGQNLVARLSWGSLRQQANITFTEPRFLGRDLRAGFDLYHYRYNLQNESSFDWVSTGVGLRAGWPINDYTGLSIRYNLKSDSIEVPNGYCPGFGSRALCEQVGSFLSSTVGYTLNVNRTNDPVRPTRGWRGNLWQELAGIGGDVNYVRTEVSGTWFRGITSSIVFSADVSAGYISGWGGDPIRINDRFFKGGNTFRGFETAGMGPRDLLTGDALGGNMYAIGTLELTLPNFLPEEYGVRTSAFIDYGTVGMLDDRYRIDATGFPDPNIVSDISPRASAGLSVHWRSPMGPIRFDFSQILQRENYDRTETFRFSTSTQF
ncbi:MAG: outer membrane protein assembly factor BamA [Caulobacterales bacterium]|nr:outer membrane protein assembly factor BamA [Caulobacterales bacterium]